MKKLVIDNPRYLRGKEIVRKHISVECCLADSKVVPNEAYTIKELFQRHMAGNMITASSKEDVGTNATEFSEMCPLDYLEGDLTDIDTINTYMRDYQQRYAEHKTRVKQLKEEQNGKSKESSGTEE